MPGKKVFVSHAVADRPLVDALVDLLQTGCNLTVEQIFASSIQGVNIPKGQRFEQYMQEQIRDAGIVVELITPTYWASAFCLCELGAQWGLGLPAFPLLVPPQAFGDLKAVLEARQAGVIDRADDLDDLRDAIERELGAKTTTARWSAKRDTFLNKVLPPLLADIQPAPIVPAADHEALLEQTAALEDLLAERDSELRAAVQRFEQLKAARTHAEVEDALRPDEDEAEELEQLRRAAQDALGQLPRCVTEAIFQSECGWTPEVGWRPDDGEWPEADREVRRGLLTDDASGEGYWPNWDNPKVSRARTAVRALTEWVPSDEAETAFVAEHDTQWDTKSQEWWEAMGLL